MLIVKIVLLIVAVLFGLYVLFLLGRAVYSLYNQRKSRRCLELGNVKAREGDVPTALSLFLKAESAWELNRYDGGPESMLHDLKQYSAIADAIARYSGRDAETVHSDIKATVREMGDLLRDPTSFGVDGRRLQPDAALRWTASCERLNLMRPKLRSICNPKYPR